MVVDFLSPLPEERIFPVVRSDIFERSLSRVFQERFQLPLTRFPPPFPSAWVNVVADGGYADGIWSFYILPPIGAALPLKSVGFHVDFSEIQISICVCEKEKTEGEQEICISVVAV